MRNTVGYVLSDEQRFNHFPATPMCGLTWWLSGEDLISHQVTSDSLSTSASTIARVKSRWTLSGPMTQPFSSWSPGAIHGMAVMFMPDALHAMTGIEPSALVNQFVNAEPLLPPDWQAMCEAVQLAPDDASRLGLLEAFLLPRWQACRPGHSPLFDRYADWIAHLAQRAAMSGPGRSVRQMERRIKRWSGLPMRELRGLSRSEQSFFAAATAQAEGRVDWSQLALDAGYSDQSHLCRVSRRVTGFSPERLSVGIQNEEPFWSYRLWV